MRPLLGPVGRVLLRRLLARRALFAFDFDGTLAPLADDPRSVFLTSATAARLRALARRVDCAVISGRARADLEPRLPQIPLRALVGNHGLEHEGHPPEDHAGLKEAVARMTGLATEGVVVEDKGLTVTVHFRCAPRVRLRALRALASVPGLRLVPGRRSVALLPFGRGDKGLALTRIMADLRADAAFYVGDDRTDEDVFALRGRVDLVSARVGRSARSTAEFHLRRRAEVDDLLEFLLSELASN